MDFTLWNSLRILSFIQNVWSRFGRSFQQQIADDIFRWHSLHPHTPIDTHTHTHRTPHTPHPLQVTATLCPGLICFGWRKLCTRGQNARCHGNLFSFFHGNHNIPAACQTFAMAQLSIYGWWHCAGPSGSPPFQRFQSNTQCQNLNDLKQQRVFALLFYI